MGSKTNKETDLTENLVIFRETRMCKSELSELSRLQSSVSASVLHCADLESGGFYWCLGKIYAEKHKVRLLSLVLLIISYFFLYFLNYCLSLQMQVKNFLWTHSKHTCTN